ncbi:MAG: glycosyltransferase family 2 protein [Candidatus Gracilibacteria bacterium]
MEKIPLISICIPTYNRKKYLKQCLDSIVNQDCFTENQIEIIISDNDSNDNTEKLVKEYQINYKNIKYFINDNNIGANKNILKASEYAIGKYIWFMGDDDKIINGKIVEILEFINKYNDITVFQTNMISGNNDIYIVNEGITFFKNLLKNNDFRLINFMSFIPTIIVKKDNFLLNLNLLKNSFIDNLGDSYSHSYILLRCIYKNKIGLLGNFIEYGNGNELKNEWKTDYKKWHKVVLVNGIYKYYDVFDFLKKANISKKDLDKLKSFFEKKYKIILIIGIIRKIGLYKPLSTLWRKYILKLIKNA